MARSYRGSKSRKPNTKEEGRRPSGKRKGCAKDERYEEDRPRNNDLSWYSRNPSLLVAAASFPYPYRPGMSVPSNTSGNPFTIPGVLAIDWVPYVGNSTKTSDPISIAGQEMYTSVRKAFSGELDADAPDFIMYIMALDSIFSYIGWLKRIYRAISTYSPENFSIPNALLYACKITDAAAIQELRQNKVKFWQNINELILASRKFRCPAVMDLFNRHYWLSDNVYADSPTLMAQLYAFNLVGVYKMSQVTISGDTAGNKAAGLTYVACPTPSGGKILDQLIATGQSLISALDTWSSGYTISGYLQRAYEGTPNFAVAELEQNELITTSYSQEVLSQIENTRTINMPGIDLTSEVLKWTVAQAVVTNTIVSPNSLSAPISQDAQPQQFAYWWNQFGPTGGKLSHGYLNIHADQPAAGDSVIASRLHAITDVKFTATTQPSGGSIGKWGSVAVTIHAATEIPIGLRSCNIDYAGNPINLPVYQQLVFGADYTLTSADVTAFESFCMLSQSDWHPFIYVYTKKLSGGMREQLFGDVYNLATPSVADFENLHRVCIYSELNAFAI